MSGKSEADLTKGISNETVCRYFYYVFIFVSTLAVLSVLMDIIIMTNNPKMGVTLLVRSLPILLIGITNSAFTYIICARTLLK